MPPKTEAELLELVRADRLVLTQRAAEQTAVDAEATKESVPAVRIQLMQIWGPDWMPIDMPTMSRNMIAPSRGTVRVSRRVPLGAGAGRRGCNGTCRRARWARP
jgi:hypothetical protein